MGKGEAQLQNKTLQLMHNLNNCVAALDGNLQFLEEFELPRATVIEILADLRKAVTATKRVSIGLSALASDLD
jgi:hypothetical protein